MVNSLNSDKYIVLEISNIGNWSLRMVLITFVLILWTSTLV